MPEELLRIGDHIEWLRTIIRRRSYGVETEFHFATPDGVLSVAIDTFPNHEFLACVLQTDCLAIHERTLRERGWTEDTRSEIRVNDDDDIAFAVLVGSYVRWGVIEAVSEQSGSKGDTVP